MAVAFLCVFALVRKRLFVKAKIRVPKVFFQFLTLLENTLHVIVQNIFTVSCPMVSMIFIIYLPKLSHLFPVSVQFNSPCITTLYIRATLIVLRGILNLHLKLNYATTLKPLFICFCCNKLFWGVCTINYSMVFY